MNESKVEVKGFEARHYDTLMNVISLGSYSRFIHSAMAKMAIQPSDRILDLGCGTGRNSCLMAKYLSDSGSIVGLDIGEEMILQFEKKCQRYPNVSLQKLRIDEPLPFRSEFDKALLSFVFHGFPDEKKVAILDNIKKALKPGGQLFILDWNEFDLKDTPFVFQRVFQKVECPLALEYVKVDWKKNLTEHGFGNFEENLFFRTLIRLLKAELK
ncbi:MAG: class I SAM-dependent methyltransferase [Candidatus Zhuqueibacterota bacterium]